MTRPMILWTLLVAAAVAAPGCDTDADAVGGPPAVAETCQETAERFSLMVGGTIEAIPDLLSCTTGSDCTAATPRLECQRGGEPTGALENCPMAIARDQLQAWTSYLGDHAGDFCPTDCIATPGCLEMDTICDAGTCALVPAATP